MQSVTPKNGNTFTGQTGAILSGARLLTGFVQSGSTWVIGGQTQQGPIRGECLAAYPRCSYPEELFIDDVRMTHVASLSAGRAREMVFRLRRRPNLYRRRSCGSQGRDERDACRLHGERQRCDDSQSDD